MSLPICKPSIHPHPHAYPYPHPHPHKKGLESIVKYKVLVVTVFARPSCFPSLEARQAWEQGRTSPRQGDHESSVHQANSERDLRPRLEPTLRLKVLRNSLGRRWGGRWCYTGPCCLVCYLCTIACVEPRPARCVRGLWLNTLRPPLFRCGAKHTLDAKTERR